MKDDTTNLTQDRTIMVSSAAEDRSPIQRKASLIVLAGWEIGREIELVGEVQVFGRSPKVALQILSPSISRQHAKIERRREGEDDIYVVTDLQSSNGTRVNNVVITSARLNHGDKVQMGDVLFKFLLQDTDDAQFHQNVHRLIHYDQLTGLLTMDAFRRYLDAELRHTSATRRCALAMTDLDGLKRVNDTHGHLAGRMVVREMGVIMRASVRPQDYAALYGGDEAVILFPQTPLEEALVVAARLRAAIEAREFEYQGKTFRVSISQGLSEWPRHGRTAEQLIAAADGALYAAKAAGRNCVRTAP